MFGTAAVTDIVLLVPACLQWHTGLWKWRSSAAQQPCLWKARLLCTRGKSTEQLAGGSNTHLHCHAPPHWQTGVRYDSEPTHAWLQAHCRVPRHSSGRMDLGCCHARHMYPYVCLLWACAALTTSCMLITPLVASFDGNSWQAMATPDAEREN